MARLSDLFGETPLLGSVESAADYAPIPNGTYLAETSSGKLGQHPNTGSCYYKIHWRIAEGEYAGRLVFQDLYLTEKALPYSQRDLGKIGITTDDQMEKPIPDVTCKIKVALRVLDNGTEQNEVRNIEFVKENTDAFAPLVKQPELVQETVHQTSEDDTSIKHTEFLQELEDLDQDSKPKSDDYDEKVASWHRETGGAHLPDHVQWVADAIPVDNAILHSALVLAVSVVPTAVDQSIVCLREFGLKEIVLGEESAYWWESERPALPIEGGVND